MHIKWQTWRNKTNDKEQNKKVLKLSIINHLFFGFSVIWTTQAIYIQALCRDLNADILCCSLRPF